MLNRCEEKFFLLENVEKYTEEEYEKAIHNSNCEVINVPKENLLKNIFVVNELQEPIYDYKETLYKFKNIDGYFYVKNNVDRWGYFCYYDNKTKTCTKIMERGIDGIYEYKGRIYALECRAYRWNNSKSCANVYEIAFSKGNLYVRKVLEDEFCDVERFTFSGGVIITSKRVGGEVFSTPLLEK